jgi:hypothetical protein
MESTTVGTKVVLLLAEKDGLSENQLPDAVASECERIARDLDPSCRVRGAVTLSADDARELAAAWDVADGDVTDFSHGTYRCAILLSGPAGVLDDLVSASTRVASRLDGLIDPAKSSAVAGTEETYLAGEEQFVYLYTIHRRADVSGEYFHDYWRLEHTKLMMHIPSFMYKQDHAATYASELARDASGLADATIDGVVEGYAASLEGFRDFAAWERAHHVEKDEDMFVDVSQSTLGYYRFL